jgi:glycosyltransferase involved in cell wall biosynthesis
MPALDAAPTITRALAALGEGANGPDGLEGLVRERIVVDGGSTDGTAALARAAGARVVPAPRGRGIQLATGATAATGEWLLFVHADTVLDPGWGRAAAAFMASHPTGGRAAYFRFTLDDPRPAARRLERLVATRCRLLALPYGDQGLLIHRTLYDAAGGFRPLPLFEDVDIARRITRGRLAALDVAAVTSADRYLRSGYLLRPARNLCCLGLYFLGVPPRLIERIYG